MGRAERYDRVAPLLEELIQKAHASSYSLAASTEAQVTALFDTKGSLSLRELALIAVVGRLLDERYAPSVDFYGCSPRALFPRYIRPVFDKHKVPHTADPTVAMSKAQNLTEDWAAKRQAKHAARHLVRLVEQVDEMSSTELENLAAALLARFLEKARRVEKLGFEPAPKSDPLHLHQLCQRLSEQPHGGNVPQRIVGYLLEAYHEGLSTGVEVTGHEDSAFATNASRGKPGDIIEWGTDGSPGCVYEVTLKTFTRSRLEESFNGIEAYEAASGVSVPEVLVICRPDDAPSGVKDERHHSAYLGTQQHEGVSYQFLDVDEWMLAQLLRMPASARVGFYSKLHSYIAEEHNTPEDLKQLWRDLEGPTSEGGPAIPFAQDLPA